MDATPKWLGYITEDILIHFIISNILPPSNFILKSYAWPFNSIRENNFLLFLPVCIWIKPFTISSVWWRVQSQFPTLSTMSSSTRHEDTCTSQQLHDLCQPGSTYTGPRNTLEINATSYKRDNIISALSLASMPSQDQKGKKCLGQNLLHEYFSLVFPEWRTAVSTAC